MDIMTILVAGFCIVVIAVGILCVGFFDKKGKEDRHRKYGKKLAVWAIAMP